MNNIYVDELPKSCQQCPYYEINSYADILGYKTNSHKCVLNGSVITGDCPLKPLTDRLAEERKKVVQEIKKYIEDKVYINELNETFIDEDIYKILDQIERGEK